jgi:hypothetical protein
MCHHKIREYVTVAHFLIMDLVEKHGMAGRRFTKQGWAIDMHYSIETEKCKNRVIPIYHILFILLLSHPAI